MRQWVQLLTVPSYRLNSRDYIRLPAPAGRTENSRQLTSIRFEPRTDAQGSKNTTGTSVSADVTRSTASDFVESKPSHDVGLAFAVPAKPV